MKEERLLLPLQLQDHRISLSPFLLLSLKANGQLLVVLLDTLQDGVNGVDHWEKNANFI